MGWFIAGVVLVLFFLAAVGYAQHRQKKAPRQVPGEQVDPRETTQDRERLDRPPGSGQWGL